MTLSKVTSSLPFIGETESRQTDRWQTDRQRAYRQTEGRQTEGRQTELPIICAHFSGWPLR